MYTYLYIYIFIYIYTYFHIFSLVAFFDRLRFVGGLFYSFSIDPLLGYLMISMEVLLDTTHTR